MFVEMQSTWCFGNAKVNLVIMVLDRCGFLDFFFQCVPGSMRKRILVIYAFGHCVFFTSFLVSFCFCLQLSRSLVCAFVCSFLQLHSLLNVCSI